ncbi:MAG: hypothetical protein ABIF77_21420 [bacterium]
MGRGILCLFCMVLGSWALSELTAAETVKRPRERLYFPSGKFICQSALGFRELAADYLWFQTIQYYGSYRKGQHDLTYFQGLVDAVTQLDPRFVEAFRFSSLVLSFDMGSFDAGIDMLKRGILANPREWILPFEVGFIFYVFKRDYARASMWFDAAAAVPGAPEFAHRFAAFSHKCAGNLEVSLVLWQNLAETTISPHMRSVAERMIAQIQELAAASELEAQAGDR